MRPPSEIAPVFRIPEGTARCIGRSDRKVRPGAQRRDRAKRRPADRTERVGECRAARRLPGGAPLALQGRGLIGRVYRRERNGPWDQRARCGNAVAKLIQGERPVGDHFGYPAAPGGIEGSPTRGPAEHLRLAVIAARRESAAAPETTRIIGAIHRLTAPMPAPGPVRLLSADRSAARRSAALWSQCFPTA